jgi:hypothetical protein
MNKDSKNISIIYDRDNVSVFAVLKFLSNPDTCFIVSSTHLLYNSKRGDIKLGQTYQLIDGLSKLKSYCSTYNIFNIVNSRMLILYYVVI